MIPLLLATLGMAQTVGTLGPGDLVITEVMNNPDVAADADGEWFEVYNNSGANVDLAGLEISDLGSDFATVAGTTPLAAGAYAIIATSGDPLLNGGITPDAVVPLVLANGADELVLSFYGVVFDQIAWDGGPLWPDPTGASISLDPGFTSATDNDFGTNWCDAQAPFGSGDLGSPGSANPSCAGGTSGTGAGTGAGTGGGTGGGPGTGGGTGAGTGGGTGGGTGAGTGGTATGTGVGGTGTGTGTPTSPEYAKLGCGCTSAPAIGGWLHLALLLPLVVRRRDAAEVQSPPRL